MPEQKKKSEEIVKQEPGGALAETDFGDDAGMGFENQTQNDITIPFLGLLQKMSPQLTKTDTEYIKGAEDGDLFNTVLQQVVPSPCYIVPCYTENMYVEWVPRDDGGGFVGVHQLDSDVVEAAKEAAGSGFGKLKTAEGNDLIETFLLYALQLEEKDSKESLSPIVIAFTSTKIKVYKRIMSALRMIKGNPPMFAFRLAISSVPETNKANQPYMNFKIEPVNGSLVDSVNLPDTDFQGLLEEGRAMVKAVRGGSAKAAHDSQSGQTPKGDDDAPF